MLVLGVGNPMRGDDGVGPEVATRVARLGVPGLEVASETEPLALLDHLRQEPGHDVVVVVDATAPGPHPGRVRVLQVTAQPLVRPQRRLGSHGLGLVDAVELARSLGLLPPRLTVIGIEALSDRLGAGLSDPVRERVDDAVRLVLEALPTPATAATTEAEAEVRTACSLPPRAGSPSRAGRSRSGRHR